MGYDNHGHLLFRQLADNFEYFAGQLRIQGAGGLVEEEDLRLERQGAGDGYALLLSAGQLAGIGICTGFQIHFAKKLHGFLVDFFFRPFLHVDRRVHDIFQHRIVGEEVELLENQAEIALDLSQLIFPNIDCLAICASCDSLLVHVNDLAGIDGFQEGRAAKQGTFPGPAGADDADNFAGINLQADIFEDFIAAK